MNPDHTFWNGAAEKYSRKPVADPAAFDRKIEITRGLMRPDSVVLDIGCGTGSLALRLASAGAEVHGLDVSSEMIRFARDKARAASSSNVHFHVGPFDDSFDAFGPGSLDGLCAYSILHLLPDHRAALAKIFEMLRPGGFFVSSTVCLGESWVPFGPVITVMRWFGKAPRVSSLTKKTLCSDMLEAGFVDVEAPDVGAKKIVTFLVARKPAD